MKIFTKIILFTFISLTSCTDKKAQKTVDTSLSIDEKQEIEKIETLTNEMDKTNESLSKKAQELDAILDEIDN